MNKRIVHYVFVIMFCLSSLLFTNSCSQEVSQKTNNREENENNNDENVETNIDVVEDDTDSVSETHNQKYYFQDNSKDGVIEDTDELIEACQSFEEKTGMRIYVYVFDRDYKDVDVGNEYRDYISDEIIPEIFSNEDYICISYYVDNDVFGKVWQGEGTKYIYETTDNLDIIITNMFYACDENISRTYIESINAFTEQCIRRINPDDEDILVEYDTSADTSDDELKNQFTRTDRKKLEESLNNQANSFFIGQGNYKSMITHIVEYHDPISFVYEPINISEFDDVFSQDEKENTNDEVVYINNGIFNDFIFHVSNKIKDSEGKSLRFRDAVTRGFIGIKVTISDKESPKVKYTVIYSDELENYDTKKLNDKSAELNSEQNTLEDEVSDDEDSEDYYFIDSDSRYLTEEDLVGLSSDDLVFARNEIYARHGYIFKDSLLVEYFNSKDWYVPRLTGDEFDDAVFNSFEKKNIEFIKSHE